MGKIGFVNICHGDYVSEAATGQADRAAELLRNAGIDILRVREPVTGYKDAMEAGQTLVRGGVDGVIVFLGTWIECPVAMAFIRETEPLPLCLWGFPMYREQGRLESTGSYVSFAMFKGTLDRVRYRYLPILGFPEDPAILKKAISFCVAAISMIRLKRTRVGLVGYTSMGIYPGTFDHVLMRMRIGPEIEHVDAYTLIRRIESVDASRWEPVRREYAWLAAVSDDIGDEALRRAAQFYVALRDLVAERELDAVNIKCQYEFSKEYGMTPCVPLSLLADRGVVASCEGDILNTVSMIMLHFLTGDVVAYGDVIHHEGNTVKLSSCGFIPFSLAPEGCRNICKFRFEGFRGIHNSFVMRPGRVTVMRLVEDIGAYHILCFTGEGLDTPLRQGVMPALDVRLDGDMDKLVENYAGQHYAICYGDVSDRVRYLADMLAIGFVQV